MKNEHDESKKLLLGLLIGGVVGAGALYCVHAKQQHKTPLLKKIGKTMTDVGEILENSSLASGSDVIKNIESKIPSGADIVSSLTDWIDTGMTVWKKLKKG
jgi:hypothetical protein